MCYTIWKSGTLPCKIKAYSGLLSRVFNNSQKFSAAYLHWLYAQNPAGAVVGSDAFYEDQLVAHHAAIPVVYSFGGKTYKALLALNNATLPGHRGKGLLKQLALKTFEEGKALGYDFVITVTNQNSTNAYLSKFGFILISPLEVKIGLGKIDIGNRNEYQVRSCWDTETLNWRLSNPSASYFKKQGIAFSPTHQSLIAAQLNSNPLAEEFSKNLKRRNHFFTLWIGLAANKKMKGLFLNLPDGFKPSPLNLLHKDLSGKAPLFQKEDIVFELLDFDAY